MVPHIITIQSQIGRVASGQFKKSWEPIRDVYKSVTDGPSYIM